MKKSMILFFLLGIAGSAVHAQDEKKQALRLLQQLATTYKNTTHLSFDVQYRYAAESTPGANDYVIMLFREDKVMYLAKPGAGKTTHPVAMIDSLLVNSAGMALQLTDNKQWTTITFTFPPAYPCKKMEYVIDKKTGWLVKTVNVVRSEEMYEAAARPFIEGAVTYAVVEASYTNYQKDGFDDSVFDNDRYFKKQGAEYVTVTPFDTYKIFLGTPNL
jgi:hypothetical protein